LGSFWVEVSRTARKKKQGCSFVPNFNEFGVWEVGEVDQVNSKKHGIAFSTRQDIELEIMSLLLTHDKPR